MQTFKVLSAFYIKEKDMLLVAVEGRDERFRRGALLEDALGRRYEIAALADIGGISPENAARFTGFLVRGADDMGRLIRFVETEGGAAK